MKKEQQVQNGFTKLMKISLTQLCLAVVFTTFSFASPKAQDILDKKVSVRMDNVELRDALAQLERMADVQFGYSSKAIQGKRKVSIFANNQRLADVLTSALQPMNISYRVVNGQIILTTAEAAPLSNLDVLSPNVKPQPVPNISGTIKNEKGEALPSVNVVIKGTTKGVQTDLDGNFQIEAKAGDVLVFSFVGYTSQEIVVGNDTKINIVLKEAASLINEVTVVGSRFTKPRTDVDRPVPIDVINLKDIQQTGQVD